MSTAALHAGKEERTGRKALSFGMVMFVEIAEEVVATLIGKVDWLPR